MALENKYESKDTDKEAARVKLIEAPGEAYKIEQGMSQHIIPKYKQSTTF